MTGQELVKLIQENQFLCVTDIKYTILHLLEKQLIKPSVIIDAYASIMDEKYWQALAHFEDSCVTNHQLLNGRYEGEELEEIKKRASYNTTFSSSLNGISPILLTDEEREKYRKDFELRYGFNPETGEKSFM